MLAIYTPFSFLLRKFLPTGFFLLVDQGGALAARDYTAVSLFIALKCPHLLMMTRLPLHDIVNDLEGKSGLGLSF